MIKISERLKTVAEFVLDGNSQKIIDVGCDHAYLDIYLLQNNFNLKIIASDNKIKPLENAKKNISKYAFLDKIEICLKDGIENLDKDVDTVVISGMGTETILEILKKDTSLLKNVERIIISSNNKYFMLRSELINLGYYIKNEKIIYEDNKYYIIIEFIKGVKKYSYKKLYFGSILLKNKNELFYDYYYNILKEKEFILSQNNNKDLKKEINMIRKEIE